MPEIVSTHTNMTVHKACFYEPELKLLAERVLLEKLGLDSTAPGVDVRAAVKGDGYIQIEFVVTHNHVACVESPADGSLSSAIEGDGSGQALPEVGG
jgi:hypothetical protein